MSKMKSIALDRKLLLDAIRQSLRKLDPRVQWRNPVMMLVWGGSVYCTLAALQAQCNGNEVVFLWQLSAWLWLTVLFANFAEAVAEGRGKAQAASLRGSRASMRARKLASASHLADSVAVTSNDLRRGDLVLVNAGEQIPADGEVVEGVATVDESAVTGESAPVIRESGGDRSAVTGGTKVLSDWLVLCITADPGETFLDRMIGLVEGAVRKKTPNEVALSVLLISLTIVFLSVVVSLYPMSRASVALAGEGQPVSIAVLVALLVCLIPTTIGGLLSCIGIAGMGRLLDARVIAMSGRAVEAAGDVDTLLLDKTGTITQGNRYATTLLPAPGISMERLVEAAWLASLVDETPEGRSVVTLAKEKSPHLREPDRESFVAIPFTAVTRMSGIDWKGRAGFRKGALSAIRNAVIAAGGQFPTAVDNDAERVSARGSTPLAVMAGNEVLGLVELKDIVKPGIRERFAELRRMGIRTVMITGDNPLTASAIAAEAGVDDYLAEATPEAKLQKIRDEQAAGHMVAMTGDGTNDAPALAQADVALAMNTGTQAAKEAANMVDMDSDPTKLIEIVGIGKQMLMTRGSLTTFSVANDISKYFAIIPAAFVPIYPGLGALDVMRLGSPTQAILAAVIFNALIIVALVPLAVKGVAFRAESAAYLLRRNLLLYGLGGLVTPFIGIKLISMGLSALGV